MMKLKLFINACILFGSLISFAQSEASNSFSEAPLFQQNQIGKKIVQQVRFVDENNKTPEYQETSQECQLQDVKTKELIPNNHLTIRKGESVLLECPPSDWVGFHRFQLIPTGELPFEACLQLESCANELGWDVWWNTTKKGPYFLFKGTNEGDVSFDVAYSFIAHYPPSDIHPNIEHRFEVIGHVAVTVID